MTRYVFVSGCPRSGTTGMAKILGWAPKTFIGQERFNLRFNRNQADLVPALFEPARLRRFEKFDCGYDSYDGQPAYASGDANPEMIAGIDTATVFGDKLISLWQDFSVFDAPAWQGQTVDIVHIVRDPGAVAASYQTRFNDHNDLWQADFENGIGVWTRSVKRVSRWLGQDQARSATRMHVVRYENLFDVPEAEFIDRCRTLFSALGLDFLAVQEQGMKRIHAVGQHRKETRQNHPEVAARLEALLQPGVLHRHDDLVARSIV